MPRRSPQAWSLPIVVQPIVVRREIFCWVFAKILEDLPRLILFVFELLDGGPAGAAPGQADEGTEIVARAKAGVPRQLPELHLFGVAQLDVLRLPRQRSW